MPPEHLVGFGGNVPQDAVARARCALQAYGVESPLTHESPWLTVAFGRSARIPTVNTGMFAIVAGRVFTEGSSVGRLLSSSDAPVHLRYEGSLLVSDNETRSVYLARDHLGHGSVYWTSVDGCVAFATELRLLLGVLRRRPAPDSTAIALWLGLDASRTDTSLYEGVSQVPPGHRLVFVPGSGARVEKYWAPTYAPPERRTVDEAADEVSPVVLQALTRRFDPDGRTGVRMSGGLDSATVAGMAHAIRKDVVAYSDVFPTAPEVDETLWIDKTVDFLGIESVRVSVEPQGVLFDLADFIQTWSVPPDSANFWGQALLSQAARDGVGTLFTGEGGDEVFAVHAALIADCLRQGRPLKAYHLARALPGMLLYPHPRPVASAIWQASVTAFPALEHHRHAAGANYASWLLPASRSAIAAAADRDAYRRLDGPHWWRAVVHALTTCVPAVGAPTLFRRDGERSGLSVCSPLLDVDVVEKALSFSPDIGFNGILSKPLLRAVARGYLPETVRLRRGKARFAQIVFDGVRGTDFEQMAALLRGPQAQVAAYVDLDVVARELLDKRPRAHGDVAEDWAFMLYRLVALECWLRQESDSHFLEHLRDESKAVKRAVHRVAGGRASE